MRAQGENAVGFARSGFSAKLDFTGRSLKSVESILQMIREHLQSPEHTWTDKQLWSFCLMLGGYVGEVLRRECGGEWQVSPLTAPILQITAGGGCVSTSPCEKVHERLTDGPNDSIYQYYQSLAQAIVPAMSGQPAPPTGVDAGDSDVPRVHHSSGSYSVCLPAGWKSYERQNMLSAYPPDGKSLISFIGNKGWIPFENFAAASVNYKAPQYTPATSPRDIDGVNSIGRVFEFMRHDAKGDSAALAYCLQCPTFMLFVSVLTPSPAPEELRNTFDGLVRSVLMRE